MSKDCKKLTLIEQNDMARMKAALRQIFGGRTIRKHPKVVNEVCLIEVTTGDRNVRPINLIFT